MSGNHPMVALVIPVHNNKEDTKGFLESLKHVSYPNYKVIIIDDGSTDGTEEMIKQKYPYVLLLKGDGTLWWAHATNIGVEKAMEIGADYVIFGGINDSVVDREFISAMVDTAEQNPCSLVTPKVYSYHDPKRVQSVGFEMNWLRGGVKPISSNEIDEGQHDVQRDVKAAPITLLSIAVFKDIGLLDYKSFPHFKGDADFTYRAYKRGYRIIYQPRSKIWHKGGATAKKKLLAGSNRYFITSPVSTLIYALSSKSRGTGLSFREWAHFYLRHYRLYFPYILVYCAVRHLLREVKRKYGKTQVSEQCYVTKMKL